MSSRKNPFGGPWLGLIFAVVGLVLISATLTGVSQDNALATDGQTTTATLTTALYRPGGCNRKTERETCWPASFELSYEYSVAGQSYSGTETVPLTNDDKERATALVLETLRNGTEDAPINLPYLPDDPQIRAARERIDILYLPSDPSIHRIQGDWQGKGNSWVGILAGLVFIAIGGLMVFTSPMGQRLRKRFGI